MLLLYLTLSSYCEILCDIIVVQITVRFWVLLKKKKFNKKTLVQTTTIFTRLQIIVGLLQV